MHVHDLKATPLQQMISALSGAIITTLVTTPMEVIKIRMQLPQQLNPSIYDSELSSHHQNDDLIVRKPNHYKGRIKGIGMKKAFRNIKQVNGIQGFWAGLGPTLISALPSSIVYFVAYEYFKERFSTLHHTPWTSSTYTKSDVNLSIPFMSSIISRFITASLTTPFEMVRIQMQSDRLSYGQVNVILKNIVVTNGVGGLWCSLKPVVLRDVPFSAIYWTVYETIKHYFPKNTSNLSSSFIGGAISGALAAILTTPFDVVTTCIQSDMGRQLLQGQMPVKSSIAQRLIEIYRLRGVEGLFAGVSMRLCKVAPSCAIMISMFEYGNNYFQNINKTKPTIKSDR